MVVEKSERGGKDFPSAHCQAGPDPNPEPLAPNPSFTMPVIHEEPIKACPARSYGGAATRSRRIAGATKAPADGSQLAAHGLGIPGG